LRDRVSISWESHLNKQSDENEAAIF